MDVPTSRPSFSIAPEMGPQEEEAVLRVLRSGRIAAGPEVANFEAEFAAFANTAHAVAASSGTTALQMALVANGVRPGDEVIVPALTFIASANAVVAVGATPVFVDLAPGSYALDPQAAEAAVTKRTRALMAVHLYGIPAPLPALADVCDRQGLSLIEDAAQAHGATIDGRPVGSWGTGAFSFYATKNMTTGEGGMVTTNHSDVADIARSYANHGRASGAGGNATAYDHPHFGLNYRMTDIAAAIGRVQLRRLEEGNGRRRELGRRLLEIVPPNLRTAIPHGCNPVWHLFPTLATDRDHRGRLMDRLKVNGVPTGIFYPAPVYRMARHLPHADCPVAEGVCDRLVCLRLVPYDDATRVRYAEAVGNALAEAGGE